VSDFRLLVTMSRAEVIKKYRLDRLPKHLRDELLAAMPVAATNDGKPVYFEGQVDAFLLERFPYPPAPAHYERVVSARPRGGRRITTNDEAIYALELKKEGKTYYEIVPLMKTKWPKRAHAFNIDSVRKTVQRYEKRMQKGSIR